MLLSLLWAQLFAPVLGQIAGPGHFFFQWPTETSQCQVRTGPVGAGIEGLSCSLLGTGGGACARDEPRAELDLWVSA
jgi:hypothetical protein